MNNLKGKKYKNTTKVTLMIEEPLIDLIREMTKMNNQTISGLTNELLKKSLGIAK